MSKEARDKKEKYRKIMGEIKETSFPILKNNKIHIFTMDSYSRFYALSLWVPPFMRFILVSKSSEVFNDSCLEGLLAHELCHHEKYVRMGFINYLKFLFKYIISRKSRTSEEKHTDRLTIEKGYGKHLYELSVIQFQDKRHEKINRYYSSLEEIESFAKEIGKW